MGMPYLIPVDVCKPDDLGFGGLLSNRCRISAPVDLIGRTQVWDNWKLTGFTDIVISTGIPMKSGCSGEIYVRARGAMQSRGRFLDFASLRSK